mmetsp:Transcript_28734/g.73104  ORF Transcript_28734/g.73104 Transcript_28734/m.73104 type:complete len:206 (-) Transcript_28734:1095-1712(-)
MLKRWLANYIKLQSNGCLKSSQPDTSLKTTDPQTGHTHSTWATPCGSLVRRGSTQPPLWSWRAPPHLVRPPLQFKLRRILCIAAYSKSIIQQQQTVWTRSTFTGHSRVKAAMSWRATDATICSASSSGWSTAKQLRQPCILPTSLSTTAAMVVTSRSGTTRRIRCALVCAWLNRPTWLVAPDVVAASWHAPHSSYPIDSGQSRHW